MKLLVLISFSSTAFISLLPAQNISLVRAAELATKFVAEQKTEGKPMMEFFTISALRRTATPEKIEPTTVIWRAELEETSLQRTTETTNVIVMVDGKKYRRIVEIRNDESVTMGTLYAEPRQMVIRPRVVPAAK